MCGARRAARHDVANAAGQKGRWPLEERHRPQTPIPQLLQTDHGDPVRRVSRCTRLDDGYCQGIYSSWRTGRACGERFDFMAIVGMDRLNFRAVNKFRKRDLDALRGMFATLVLGTPKHCAKDDPEQDGGSGSCR